MFGQQIIPHARQKARLAEERARARFDGSFEGVRVLMMVAAALVSCKGKTEDTPKRLVQHDDLGTIAQPEVAPVEALRDEPAPVPAPPDDRVGANATTWPNAPDGSRLVGDWQINSLGAGPGHVYACANGRVRAAPKSGGATIDRGACGHAFAILTDGTNMFWCDDRGPTMLSPQGAPRSLVDVADSCIPGAVDDTHFYYIVPAFEGVPNAGLYRVGKDGGEPTLLLPTRKGVQLMIALDADNIWIGSWGAGTIARMKKSGGAASVVVSGQKGIVELLSSSDDIYWYSESSLEIRKRGKRGGAITTVAKNVTNEPVALHDGVLYWASAESDDLRPTSTLYRLRPGATEPSVIMTGLRYPDFVVDDDGVFVNQSDETGVLAIPHLER
jgi:hypothetical protein